MAIKQIQWSSPRNDISFSVSPAQVYQRFYIIEATEGFTVLDKATERKENFATLAAARSWAGIQVDEKVIRHG